MFLLMLLYLVLTIIRPQDYIAAMAQIPVMPVALVLAFLAWLASSRKSFAAPQTLLLPTFLLAMMASQVANGWAGGALVQAEVFGPSVLAFLVLATAVSESRQRVRTTMMVLTVCAMVLAAHGVDQSINGVGWTGMPIGEHGRIQYVGIFQDPNDLGMLFVTALPMAFYLSSGGLLRRLFWLAGAALLLYGIFLTNSRGTMLAVLVVAGGYLWHRRGALTAGGVALAGLVVMRALSSRMQELDADESSAAGRVDAWYEGLQMFLQQPLFGIGAGNFTDYNYLTAHNSFVLVLAETGIVGFTLWLAFVGYSFWMMATILRSPEPLAVGSPASTPPTGPLLAHAGMLQQPMPADDRTGLGDGQLAMRHEPFTQLEPAAAQESAQAPSSAATRADWAAERGLALSLLLSLCGMFAAAFFLSRSYTVIIYLVIAVVVGEYMGARRRFPELREFSLGEGWWRWIPAAIGTIVALFVLVKLLLVSQ